VVSAQSRSRVERPSLLAIVPARAGSKGIPNKNIADVGGRPMVEWSLIAAQESTAISAIEVSTDDARIVELARHRGLLVSRMRPLNLADDSASMNSVIQDVIEHSSYSACDYLVLLQPTSPLRTAAHIDQAMAALLESGRESLVSVTLSREKVFWSYTISDGAELRPIFPDMLSIRSRHELPTTYSLNGAIYICRTRRFLAMHELVHPDSLPFLMNQETSIDIDSPIDLELARSLIKMRSQTSR
jgi:N-acylneuraminate cytidylyltransferase